MSKILIIAEKPSVASKIAMALINDIKKARKDGYYEDSNYVISNCIGHLFELKKPQEIDEKYSKWDINNYPIVLDKIPLKIKDDSGIKKQFKILKDLMNRNDISEVVNACDADREGEGIFRDVFYASKCQKTATRMWIESMANSEVIKETFENRLPQTKYTNLYQAQIGRRYADYLIGMNSSGVLAVKSGQVLATGRVITPTLRIIVDLENEINNFISKPYWQIYAVTNKDFEAKYFNEDLENNRFYKKDDALNLIEKVGCGKAKIITLENTTRNEKAPKLFNLSDLQIEMNKKYGYSAQEVLDACQSLYEKHGLTTYPRTSENRISPELANQTYKIINNLYDGQFKKQKDTILNNHYKINSSCIATKEIGSHEALTPTTKNVTESVIDNLNECELNTYKTIVERFLINFYPNAVYSVQKITLERNGELFKNTIESIKEKGFYEGFINIPNLKTNKFIDIKQNEYIDIIDFKLNEGKTEPPSRFSEGTLIKMMANPIKYVEDKESKDILKEVQGIGTEATRATILESLKKRKYIEVKKSTIYPTELGKHLIEIIPSDKLKSIPLTVEMEKDLKLIQTGKEKKEDYLIKVNNFIKDFVNDVRNSNITSVKNESKPQLEPICRCPNCNNFIVEGKIAFGCSNYKNGCKVAIYYNALEKLGKKTISKTLAIQLLTKGKTTSKVKGFKSKSGKEYEAYVTYKYQPNEKFPNVINIEFD